jgi:DNA (cytosine-5)-methyltransferase 1
MTLTVLDLFSGIGGFSLGLERTGGFRTVAFCEIEPYCRRVLARHWPGVPCYDDVRTLDAARLDADGVGRIDVICGGFPCQDISFAGKGAGLAGERSGLWREYARLIGELRPRYVLVENVAALLGRGLDRVLGDLAEIRFDAEWHCIPASAVGAPHRRDRLWLVACSAGIGQPVTGHVQKHNAAPTDREASRFGSDGQDVADASGERRGEARGLRRDQPEERATGGGEEVPDTSRPRLQGCGASFRIQSELARFGGGGWWSAEPDVGRVAHGVPDRAHRLRAIGNAVVPQIPELLGRAILASMREAA